MSERYDPISGEDLYAAALERIAALEAESVMLRRGLTASIANTRQAIEERDALKAQVERLTAALEQAAEGLDMAINRFRKMGIMEEAERYFPYLHVVDAACASQQKEQK